MDAVLLPYLNATTDATSEQCLDELVLFHATPVIRKVLRFRLGLHVNDHGTNRDNHEAEDAYQDIATKVIQTLHDLKQSSSLSEIEDFRRYVTSIAINACMDLLRSKSPVKYRLKHNIRDIFNRHQDFRAWKSGSETVGGFATWQDMDRSPASERQMEEFETELDTFHVARFANENIHQVPLTRIVAEVLQWIDRPIRIDDLTTVVGLLLRVQDRRSEEASFDETLLVPPNDVSAESALAAKELLAQVWQILKGMPPPQRDTYCLNFEDSSGSDLFSLLVETGVASLPQIAKALGRSVKDIIRLRSQMPMDYSTIAAELGAKRSLVAQWRFRAIQRMRKELGFESGKK